MCITWFWQNIQSWIVQYLRYIYLDKYVYNMALTEYSVLGSTIFAVYLLGQMRVLPCSERTFSAKQYNISRILTWTKMCITWFWKNILSFAVGPLILRSWICTWSVSFPGATCACRRTLTPCRPIIPATINCNTSFIIHITSTVKPVLWGHPWDQENGLIRQVTS